MNDALTVINKALQEGRTTLSERESKDLLGRFKVPVTREIEASDRQGFIEAVRSIGYPLVIKGSSPNLTHKTEHGLVKVDVRNEDEALGAFQEIMDGMKDEEQPAVLVQEMVKGNRELMIGMTRDAQFGPCVMFGLGGVFTEILKDVAFRVAPITKRDALDMMRGIKAYRILEEIRGLPAADLDQLSEILIRVGEIGLEYEAVKEIDINPLILSGSKPVAVDALVVLNPVNA
jgi:acyl-CoA synthetase (NDP forming)